MHASRALATSPGFAFAAIVTLAARRSPSSRSVVSKRRRPIHAARDAAVVNLGAAAGIVKSSHAFFDYSTRLTSRGSERGFTAGAWIRW
jgi:hypothetical protein